MPFEGKSCVKRKNELLIRENVFKIRGNDLNCTIRYDDLRLLYWKQWRIQNFKNREVQLRRGIIFTLWKLFDAPSHIPYAFVVRVEKKTYCKNCILIRIKFVRVLKSKVKIKNFENFEKGGGTPDAPALDPPLENPHVHSELS